MTPKYEWVVFADGGCKDSVATIGGLVMNMATGDRVTFSKKVAGAGTNNFAELTAILYALGEVSTPRAETRVLVNTDSQYAIGVLSQFHRARTNQALIWKIRSLMAEFASVEYRWVRGHVGHEGNSIADDLARKARS